VSEQAHAAEESSFPPLWFRALGWLPRKKLSQLVGKIVHAQEPKFFASFLKYSLTKAFGIKIAEAERPYDDYASFGQFFARRLKEGARDFSQEGFLSPCDGRLDQWGSIEDGTLLQCKGKTYDLGTLLGDRELAKSYEGGRFMTIYLAPFNYHRVHWGLDGELSWTRWIDGDLWPVNKTSVQHVPELFCVNERCLSELNSEHGKMSSVMVGATNVGWMEMAHLDEDVQKIMKKRGGYVIHGGEHSPKWSVSKGDEFGLFNMGSTVVLVLDSELSARYDWSRLERKAVVAGEVLGVKL
jgi:phosphatidylserine decarboxylase